MVNEVIETENREQPVEVKQEETQQNKVETEKIQISSLEITRAKEINYGRMDMFIQKLINWEWYQDGNTCRLFIHLLLLANYEDKYWQGQLIKRGQLVTSLEHLSDDLGLSVQK